MSRRTRSWIVSAGVAIMVAGLAILLRAALTPLWGTRFIFTFAFPAVVIAAWYGRLTGGLIATALLTVAGIRYVAPIGTFTISDAEDFLAVSLFAAFGVAISSIIDRLHHQNATAERLAEAARDADAQRRAVLESIQDGFVVLDEDWRFVYANAQAERMVGAHPGGLLGKQLWERYGDLAGTPFETACRRVAASGTGEQLEHYYPRLDKWFQMRIYPATQGGVSLLFADVTEQKRMVDRLREFGSTLEAIVEGTDEFIYAKDREGRFTLVNGAVLKLLGKRREEVIGRTVTELLPDAGEASVIAASDREVMQTGRTETVEETVAAPFGAHTYLTTKSPRFDEHGRVMGIIGVATDITVRKRVEAELRDAHDSLAQEVVERTAELAALSHHLLQVSEAEKAKLAAELHDALGGSLTTLVVGLARLRAHSQPLSETQAAAFSQVEATLHDVVQMTRRIIGDLRPVALDTLGLAATLQEHVEKWSRASGVEVKLALPPDLSGCAPDVALVVFRIVQEALTNVAKHAYASRVEIEIVERDGRLVVSIADNGVGIRRQPRPTASHGLLGMRERAAGCGGTLQIDSGTGGRGTHIVLTVPQRASRPDAELRPPPDAELRPPPDVASDGQSA